jgi:hypothetical protein
MDLSLELVFYSLGPCINYGQQGLLWMYHKYTSSLSIDGKSTEGGNA